MKSHEIRNAFVEYFKRTGHTFVPSSRLVPENDPTLLFTNAGMNQFKNVFLGLEERDYNRAVSTQKCVRAGGKHNDLENVGHTARHHTFFEMLGNFSFGDYFKKDAIHFAWEFLTKELQLDKDRLYVTVFHDDDEAADIWHQQEGVPKDRIYRFGEKDNFWRMGDTGPCGPSSEIFYDLGPEVGGDPKENVVGGEGDRFIEIWNLVFMQYFEDAEGKLTPLPKPSIDTGLGLERTTAILQGELSNYHIDTFQNLMSIASELSGVNYHKSLSDVPEKDHALIEQNNVALRVLADHARASAFLLADGVLPSNEGRGYVLRRIMRRAIRYGHKMAPEKSLLPAVVQGVIDEMSDFYPELKQQQALIKNSVQDEEKRFLQTLDQGTQILNEKLEQIEKKGETILDGTTAFKLYDTFGFPVDLTRLMAKEKGVEVDEKQFQEEMEKAREKAKASWKGKGLSADAAHLIQASQALVKDQGPTEFTGYGGLQEQDATLMLLSDGSSEKEALATNQDAVLAFDKTPFYAESGGQVGDTGVIQGPNGRAEVYDCTKQNDIHLHHVKVVDGSFKKGDVCHLHVVSAKRRSTAANHSATHLLHAALRNTLGEHVTQAGSLVEPDRLRFDFTHNKGLTADEIRKIEDTVNAEIANATKVTTARMSPKEAMEAGALALFGEKYGDEVRVIQMGNFSMELCGGTHVANTSEIRLFKIVSESGVSAGVRRVEAITGEAAARFALLSTRENLEAREATGTSIGWAQYIAETGAQEKSHSVVQWIENAKQEIKDLQKQIQNLKGSQVDIDGLIQEAQAFSKGGKEARLVFADIPMDDRKVLSEISDKLRDKLKTGVVIVVGQGEKSHPVIVSVSKDLSKEVNAGQTLKEVASVMGGKGGGRPDFAQGAASDRSKLKEAREKAYSVVAGA